MPDDAEKYWSSLYQELSRAFSAEGVPESAFKSWYDAVEAFQSEFQTTIREAGVHGPETANCYRAFGFSLLAAHEPQRAARMLFQAWTLRPRPLDLTSSEQYHEFKALRGLLVHFGLLQDAITIQEEVAS